jgi:hypothetical protein
MTAGTDRETEPPRSLARSPLLERGGVPPAEAGWRVFAWRVNMVADRSATTEASK